MSELLDELKEERGKFESIARELLASQPRANSNKQEIHVSAGGIGIWICASACMVMFVITLGIGWLYLDESRRLDVANDKLSVILQWAPQLRDIVDKNIQQEKHP